MRAQALALPVGYTTIEPHPLERDVWGELNYATDEFSSSQFQLLHRADWGSHTFINQHFELCKLRKRLEEVTLSRRYYDVVYFDAFAPVKQPEMWQREQLERVVVAMNDEAVFVTYCASGQLKRDLRALGLKVEGLEGPPGKREMVRAKK
jgi:tRNA U34 5-methylaminomethyl-2-thiouridine-forming methyltransferase MnmC